MGVLLVAMLAGLSSVTSSSILGQSNEETNTALQAARGMMETLRGLSATDVLRLYNQNGADDPGVPGSAPGPDFAVDTLAAQTGDLDGLAGEVVLPLTAAGQLLENQNRPEFGLPRDLNGDGLIDNLDHSGDYTILPLTVLVRWQGRTRDRQFGFSTILGAGR